jgi:hypothetical protein
LIEGGPPSIGYRLKTGLVAKPLRTLATQERVDASRESVTVPAASEEKWDQNGPKS